VLSCLITVESRAFQPRSRIDCFGN